MCPWRRRELIAGIAAKVVRWLAVEAIVVVAWLASWSFGSDVGCCNGGGGDRGCVDGGVVGVVVTGSDVGCCNGGGDVVGSK